jgi:hypothetical protein
MTIREAADIWSDPRRIHLTKWKKEFNQPLEGLHSGHVYTYRRERLQEVPASVVDAEIDALRALLKEAGEGEKIERYYQRMAEDVTLTAEELNALPPRVLTYIRELEKSLADLRLEHHGTEDRLRKANWANWSRRR